MGQVLSHISSDFNSSPSLLDSTLAWFSSFGEVCDFWVGSDLHAWWGSSPPAAKDGCEEEEAQGTSEQHRVWRV